MELTMTKCFTPASLALSTVSIAPSWSMMIVLSAPVLPPDPAANTTASKFSNAWEKSFSRSASTVSMPLSLNWPVCSRSEEHTSELQSRFDLVCRLLLEKKKNAEWKDNYHEFTIGDC